MEKKLNKYDWLDAEVQQMGTRRFFRTGCAVPRREEVARATPSLPRDYVDFIVRYGDTALFRVGSLSYRLSIWWPPPRRTVHRGEALIIVGKTEGSYVAFSEAEGTARYGDEVKELSPSGACRSTKKTFSIWLQEKFATYRRKYSPRAWRGLQSGPAPFTDEERAIVQARGQFGWEVMESSIPSLPTLRIHNRSTRRLPFITLDFHATVPELFIQELHGGIYVPVANLSPGDSVLVTKALTYHGRCQFMSPVVFTDPIFFEPEEREYLWEFQEMPTDG
jgi:hypothetical protein